MNIYTDNTQIFTPNGQRPTPTRGLVRDITPNGMHLRPEETEAEKQLKTSNIPIQRELTPEEEQRVLFLKNMLSQLLTMAEGQPSEEQKARIKEVEKELESLTGVKMRSRLSNATDKMVGEKDKEEQEESLRQTDGIDPEEAVHSNVPLDDPTSVNPGMMMLRKNAMHLRLRSILESSGQLETVAKLS